MGLETLSIRFGEEIEIKLPVGGAVIQNEALSI